MACVLRNLITMNDRFFRASFFFRFRNFILDLKVLLDFWHFQDMDVGESVEQRVRTVESAISKRRSSYDEARKTTISRREAWRRDVMLCELLDNMGDADLERRLSPSTSRVQMEYWYMQTFTYLTIWNCFWRTMSHLLPIYYECYWNDKNRYNETIKLNGLFAMHLLQLWKDHARCLLHKTYKLYKLFFIMYDERKCWSIISCKKYLFHYISSCFMNLNGA